MTSSLFDLVDEWPCTSVAAAAIDPVGGVHRRGATDVAFSLASITKLFTAAAALVAVEEGTLDFDHEVDGRGATVADLLAHAGGLAPDGRVLDDPGRRRIYSNAGYELVADALARAAEMPFEAYLHEGVFAPLAMSSARLVGSPAFGAQASVEDLLGFLTGLPTLLAPETIAAMTSPYLPELVGVLPGYGRQTPNTWGLGPEIRDRKTPHWTGRTNSAATWGHFGQAGTFVWVDPEVDVSLIVLTDRAFGDWALERWPALSDAVRAELSDLR